MSDIPTRSLPPAEAPTASEHAPPSTGVFAAPGAEGTQAQTPTEAATSAEQSAPVNVPGYEITAELGRGGMGVVYRAREVAFDREVALKLLQDRYRADSPAARRFLDEARITGQLQHPAIPPVHHIGTLPDGRPFLAMKLIKGDTFANLLADGGREPTGNVAEGANAPRPPHFIQVFAQVCQAIAYAHARKVIHRDLKPSNVMVGAFGEVQVMDWGLAKVLDGGRQPPDAESDEDERTEIRTMRDAGSATQAGSVLGTPSFMAPEQAGGEIGKVDERSDVFGLGAILCVILTGKPPFTGPDSDSVRLMAIRGETAEALARLDASGADPELVALAKRCLAADREARPRDAGEVAKAIDAHLAAAEERARQAELDRVRAEGERATAEAKAAEEANTRREADARLAEERKRRRVQFALAGAVVAVFALAGFGVALAGLWRDAEDAKAQLAEEKQQTDDARKEAERQRGIADNARDQAISLKIAADAARDDAIRLKGTAEKSEASERYARLKLEVFEYGRTLQLAYQEWRENNIVGATALLESVKPHLRGWEWHHVRRLCQPYLITLNGHTEAVWGTSFSPDGSRVVTWSTDNTTRVWDAKTGAQLLILNGYTLSAVFNRDGSRVVTTGSLDSTAKVWDAKTGNELLTLKGPAVMTVALNADGSRIVTAGDKTAKVWDAKSGAELLTLKGHTNAVTSALFSDDGSRIITASVDKTVRVWDAKSGAELLTSKLRVGAEGTYPSLSADGSRVVAVSADKTAKVWDTKSGAEVLTLRGHTDSVRSACFSGDGSRIVTASFDRTAKVWNASTGVEFLALKGHTGQVFSASFSADGSRVITGSVDKTAKIWDIDSSMEFLSLQTDVTAASVSSDGALFAVAVKGTILDGTAKIWDAKSRKELLTLKGHKAPVPSLSFSPDGSQIVTASWDKTAKVWDAKNGAELLTLKGHSDNLNSASFSADGSRVVTGSRDRTAKVWDAKSGAELLTLKGHLGDVRSALFSAGDSRVVTSSNTNEVKVWDAKTGAELFTIDAGVAMSLSPGGSQIGTGSHDGKVNVWDAKSGAELLTLKGHTDFVSSMSFSADGERIITGSRDRTARVWDAKSGAELLTLKGHTDAVSSALFSTDGERIITGGSEVKVWDAKTGAELLTLKGLTRVFSASFSADGVRIVAGGRDRVAKIWDAKLLNHEVLPKEPGVSPKK